MSACCVLAGDIETLLELETYMQTAKCTQRTEVLVLEMKHFDRLLVKRNPRTIDVMKLCLDLRIRSRMSSHNNLHVPLLAHLHEHVSQFQRQYSEREQSKRGKVPSERQSRKTISEYYDAFIPPPGPLIDMYGPGTVFHHIRERARVKRNRRQKKGDSHSFSDDIPDHALDAPDGAHAHKSSEYIDPMTSEHMLRGLEDRMRHWLEWDGQKQAARVQKMHRTSVEVSTNH